MFSISFVVLAGMSWQHQVIKTNIFEGGKWKKENLELISFVVAMKIHIEQCFSKLKRQKEETNDVLGINDISRIYAKLCKNGRNFVQNLNYMKNY